VVNWNAPTATDNCSAVTLQSNFNSGAIFSIGNTTVNYIATDQSGNSSDCSFVVSVISDPIPTTCANNLLVNSTLNNSNSWTGNFDISYNGNIGENVLEVCTNGQNARQILNATSGKTYTLSVDAQNGNANGFLNLKYLSSTYVPLEQNFENINSANSFDTYQLVSEAPPGTAFVEVSVNKNSGGSCVLAGNWCLTEGESTVDPPGPISSCDNNLLTNGGFENEFEGWTLFFDASITSQSISGSRSLQINSPDNRVITNLPITPNENYYLNAVASGSGEVAIALKYLNASWTPIFYKEQELILNTESKSFSEMIETAPTNAKYIEISLINKSATVAQFDDVCLTTSSGSSGNPGGSGSDPETILGSVDCAIDSERPWEEWISMVNINGLSKTSGKQVYSNFSNTIFSLEATNNEIEVTASWSYITRPLQVNVYIDWNGDEDFSSDEKLTGEMTAPSSGNNVSNDWNMSFDLPSGTTPGVKAMRVILSREENPSPCGSIAFGEVEDYLVNISAGPIFRQASESEKWIDRVHVFPNPVSDFLIIDLAEVSEATFDLILSNTLGQVLPLSKQTVTPGTSRIVIPVKNLEDGVYTLLFYFKDKKPVGKKVIVQRAR